MKKVLLTGACGFIGRQAIAPLLSRGYEVHAVARASRTRPAGDEVVWHPADLLDDTHVERLLAAVRPTHLLHFAWAVEPGEFWTSPENDRWRRASLALMQSFAEHGGQRIVISGTCAEYDGSAADRPLSERDSPLVPATPYGLSKLGLQQQMDELARQSDLSAAWGRVFFLYGPHEPPTRLVASVIRSLLQGQPALCSHGRQVRDFLHVRDVAGAFVALLDGDVRGAVNIASGIPVTLRQVATHIGDIIGCPEMLRFDAIPERAGEPARLIADVHRLRDELDWRPSLSLRAGLTDTVDWWRTR